MVGGNLVGVIRRGAVDRISELPDFIKHVILTNLDTKEACRASVLSKGWYAVWSSIPVLDFRPEDFKVEYYTGYSDDDYRNFLGFIDKTMQRYSTKKYRITKLYLELPYLDKNKTGSLIDKWIMIAVQNKIQNMEISIVKDMYTLPEILFHAKSLEVLKCRVFELPYYKTVELISLESLTLYLHYIDANMLQGIISLCPLVELDITCTMVDEVSSDQEISLPWMRKVNRGVEDRDSETLQSNPSPLQKFIYKDLYMDRSWPWKMNVVALKNLRKLEMVNASITDDIVSELAYGLVALESLVLESCRKLKYIKISSISLKKFQLIKCVDLTKVIIDTPNLLEFRCGCKVKTSVSSIRALDQCIAQFCPSMPESINISWLDKLNSFLVETNLFESLVIEMHRSPEIAAEVEEQLRNVMSSPPYKLKELKLCRIIRTKSSTNKFILAFLSAVFWCCHPDVLSVTTHLSNSATNPATKLILDVLRHLVKCWKHPLKHVEVEGIDGSSLLSERSTIEFRFRLSWR